MNETSRRLPRVAYFSMEIGLDPQIPTYCGGLGVLAGDTLKAAADAGIPMTGITLLHRRGFFRQRLDVQGNQSEEHFTWSPEDFLESLSARATIDIGGEPVRLRAWKKVLKGVTGHEVTVLFLDTFLPENSPAAQSYTDMLYGGDLRYRLAQEVVLGIGGVAILRSLGHRDFSIYHMNEGHSSLLTIALLEERLATKSEATIEEGDKEAIRSRCVFTTHTPVPAGHDQFPIDLVKDVLGSKRTDLLVQASAPMNGTLNMTNLGLTFSRFINGVAMLHGKISRGMFPHYPIDSITNGVHAASWTSSSFQRLYDRHIPEWRVDNRYLRHAVGIPLNDIRDAHDQAKRELLTEIERRTRERLNPEYFTIGFARRAATYKRADFLFSDIERLKTIAHDKGPLQIVYGGKAHPHDEGGKDTIRRIFQAAVSLRETIRIVYVEEYDMAFAHLLCAGCDVWLNTPRKPHEASGTSGMKAALNGVPSFSILDGWWVEGHVEGATGWSIGDSWGDESNPEKELASLYDKLEQTIVPLFYQRREDYLGIMRSTIALNGSFFTTQRMLSQYVEHAYASAVS